MASNPYRIVRDTEYRGIEKLLHVKAKLVKSLDPELSDVAVEAIDGLRSALDQACYACAVAIGKVNPKSAYFPFADSAADLENTIKGRCKDLPSEIVDLLRSYKPYQGANDLLWAFNKARQGNQHKILCDVVLSPIGSIFHHVEIRNAGHLVVPGFHWFDDKGEMLLFTCDAHADLDLNIKLRVAVQFNEAGPITGAPVVPSLQDLLGGVSNIVSEIEAETARLV